jgi:dipeptidyl-peptidase-3
LTEGALKRIIRLVRPETNPSWMNDITKAMVSLPPDGLGFPTENAISNYYLGERISREEISDVTKTMKKHGIEPENTRIRKNVTGGRVSFDVLQASVESEKAVLDKKEGHPEIRLVRGDHSIELERICFQYVHFQSC